VLILFAANCVVSPDNSGDKLVRAIWVAYLYRPSCVLFMLSLSSMISVVWNKVIIIITSIHLIS